MPNNVLTMNDEQFLKDFDSLPVEAPAAVVETPVETPPVETPPADETPPVEETPPAGETPPTDKPDETPPAGETPPAAPVETPPAETPIDYKAAYESIIGRAFKAGGKDITVKSVDEAVQLMQMGVGFHQKMSKMAHAERIVATLQENDLLSEEKINELVDISKKNPEAIIALVKSAGLEPHQLIPSGDAQPYTPGNHVLPEAQLLFRNSVDSIREQGGEEFLTHVAQDWDVTSRAEVYKDPRALTMIYGHKQNGLYEKISSEVERRKVFDSSVASLPFIHAYIAIGNEMHEKGMLAPQQETPAPVVTPAPVAVKPAVASQSVVTPNPAAAKAASVRSTPTPATATPNFLTMPDDEFKKNHMTP